LRSKPLLTDLREGDIAMEIITFQQLITPDKASESFGPLVPPERRLQMAQAELARLDLADVVGPQSRQSFERLRTLFIYGLLCYDLFTVVDDLSFLLLEQALGERFVEYYGGCVPLVDSDGVVDELVVQGFQEVYDAVRGGRQRTGWKLRTPPGPDMNFRGSLGDLFRWARRVELLRGQRSRVMEHLFVKMRHRVAHPRGYHLLMPQQAALSISDLSALINQLWGVPTRGSRLYDGPIDRVPIVIGWHKGSLTWMRADTLKGGHPDTRDYTFIVVQGCERDDGLYGGLSSFDTQVENTSFPTDLLWGPGSWSEAVEWIEDRRPGPDDVEYLERPFMVRVHKDQADVPRRPQVAAGLEDEPDTTWYLVRADYPLDAFVHVRNIALFGDESPCAAQGECSVCAATALASGGLAHVLDVGRDAGIDVTPVTPRDVRIPSRW
jgi:hypothetical protein